MIYEPFHVSFAANSCQPHHRLLCERVREVNAITGLLLYSAPFIVDALLNSSQFGVVYVSMESRNLCLCFWLCCCWWSCRRALEIFIVCNKNLTSMWISFKWKHNKGSRPDQNVNQFNGMERQAKFFVWNLIIETWHFPSCNLIAHFILMCRWRLFWFVCFFV